ncbi:hypothetical protein CFI14_16080 [Lactiplantibacillus pentosus]|nr:hypothetical protein [Lactiplantibacillus pentosus]AYG36892.1 hypothetical protein CFK27_02500 [Lactiplantibacillus pentosus]AYG42521.1 hypothetical protein CFI14_16080 [Lactiplantibacillus pentosus]
MVAAQHKKNKRRVIPTRVFYLLGLSMYIFYSFLQTTLFSTIVPNVVFSLFKYGCLLLFSLSILTAKFSKQQILVVLFGVLLAILVFHNSGDSSALILIVFLLSSLNNDLSTVVRIYFVIALALTLGTIGSSLLGIIDNYSYVVNGSTRWAFGFLYTTDFAAHIFYLCLVFAYLVRKHINILYSLLPTLIGLVVFYFTRAKLDTILMIVITVALLFYKYGKLEILKKGRLIISSTPFIMAIVSVGLSIAFMPNNGLFSAVDRVLTNRLAMGHLALYEYPIKFFGQYISQNGSGGLSFQTGLTSTGTNLSYFFIDSSYIKMLLAFGVVFFLIYLFGLSRTIYLNLISDKYMMPIILVIFCVSSVIDQHMLEVAYNPFLICIVTTQFWRHERLAVKK